MTTSSDLNFFVASLRLSRISPAIEYSAFAPVNLRSRLKLCQFCCLTFSYLSALASKHLNFSSGLSQILPVTGSANAKHSLAPGQLQPAGSVRVSILTLDTGTFSSAAAAFLKAFSFELPLPKLSNSPFFGSIPPSVGMSDVQL